MQAPFSGLLLASAAFLMTACTLTPVDQKKTPADAHYWQRTSASSARFMYGPKAQQMLEQDLVTCVTEVRELERLYAILPPRDPGDVTTGRPPQKNTFHGRGPQHLTAAEEQRRQEEIAETREPRADYLPFSDFRTCMDYHGWELLENTPYDLAREDAEAYVDAIIGRGYQTQIMRNDFPVEADDRSVLVHGR